MSDMVKDILLKAAEDVQSGMWCKGQYFDDGINTWLDVEVLGGAVSVDEAKQLNRCAHGSLALVTALLGGSEADYYDAARAVMGRIANRQSLIAYNDNLPDDPFAAGQTLAELFRTTAESL